MVNLVNRINHFNNGIKRTNFWCLEVTLPTNGKFMKRVLAYAEGIEGKLNKGQANSSETRSEKTVKIDNISGVLAECICYEFLSWHFGKENIIKPSSNDSRNQIDIMLSSGKKTIEVRSSCVRNGVDFALFSKSKGIKANIETQYFDVLGPYTNQYKPGEALKDYYMRVLYHCEKKDFLELLKKPEIMLYITGGATKEMMMDDNVYQLKHLVPAGGEVAVESDYRVIPLGNSLDIKELLAVIEKDIRKKES